MGDAFRLEVGDCLDVFGREPDGSFDAFVCDWPAGVRFMGRAWDGAHGGRDAWVRVWAARAAMMRQKAKPGAYSLTWALPRTAHWTMAALEDGGWTLQDVVVHAFGQGWPKGRSQLKPASEHWILARNGSGGALQIDACRVPRGSTDDARRIRARNTAGGLLNDDGWQPTRGASDGAPAGSWPTNLVLSHCPECEELGTRQVKGAARTGPNGGGDQQRALSRGAMGGLPAGYVLEHNYTAEDGTEATPAFDCLAACDCGLSLLAPAGGAPPACACGLATWWACPVAEMDRQSGSLKSGLLRAGTRRGPENAGGYSGGFPRVAALQDFGGTTGGASRFFPRFQYAAKASTGERDAGCQGLFWRKNPVHVDGELDFGWRWHIEFVQASQMDGWLVRAQFVRPDRESGIVDLGTGRPFFVRRGDTARAVWSTAFAAIKGVLEHELLEGFHVGARRVFDPHAPMRTPAREETR